MTQSDLSKHLQKPEQLIEFFRILPFAVTVIAAEPMSHCHIGDQPFRYLVTKYCPWRLDYLIYGLTDRATYSPLAASTQQEVIMNELRKLSSINILQYEATKRSRSLTANQEVQKLM